MIFSMEYKTIKELNKWLEENEIPHYFRPLFDGWQILIPGPGKPKYSIIQHYGSYGGRWELLEILSYKNMEAQGYLPLKEVCKIIKKNSYKKKGE